MQGVGFEGFAGVALGDGIEVRARVMSIERAMSRITMAVILGWIWTEWKKRRWKAS